MKKLPLFAMLSGLGLFAVGCAGETETTPTTTTPPADTTTEGTTPAAPAEGT